MFPDVSFIRGLQNYNLVCIWKGIKMKKNKEYNDAFYAERWDKTHYAASRVLKVILEKCSIKSCIDVGCGIGVWLNQLKKLCGNGELYVVGLDGDYVSNEYLVIEQTEFKAFNLEERINERDRFDLAISLEVAEHLPNTRAETFVDDLCNLSDMVLFSAAFPGQGGVHHINEQYFSYWNNLFEKRDYRLFDVIRPLIWKDENIDWWYKNNIGLWIKRGTKNEAVFCEMEQDCCNLMDVIHPEIYHNLLFNYRGLQNSFLIRWGGGAKRLLLNLRMLLTGGQKK